MSATIFARTSVNALHHWPNATKGRSYLAHPHMHTFNFEAHAVVSHDDRDIEFHDLRDLLDNAVWFILGGTDSALDGVADFGSRSCETIGKILLELLPSAVFMIEVREDEACGARIVRA